MENENKKIANSLERFLQILENSREMAWETNIDGLYTYVSSFAENMFGYKPEEIIGKKYFYDFFAPEIREAFKKAALESFSKKESFRGFINKNIKKDGTEIILETSGVPFFDEKGVFAGYRGADLDVTERERAKDDLITNNIFLSSIIENIPNMVFVKDAKDLRFIRFNKAGEDLLGYNKNDLLGKNDYDFFPKEQAEFFIKKDQDVLNKKIVLDIPEEKIQTKNKGERILHTKKIPILDDSGKPVYLLGISEDITDQKQRGFLVSEIEEKYKPLFDSMSSGFAYHKIILDDAGRPADYEFLDINPAFEKIVGLTRDQVVGKKVTEVLPGTEKDPANWIGVYGAVALEGKEIRIENYSALLKKWFLVYAYSPKKEYFATVFEDITGRKESEKILQEKVEELEKLNRFMLGRELKMVELKKENEKLKVKNENN